MTKKFRHIVASGCSQTSDGIGGTPPRQDHVGSCSFVNGADSASPVSWVSHMAVNYQVSSLCNTAAAAHGNILIHDTIIDTLERYQYNSDDTLVLFNLSWITRLDIPCGFDHFDRSNEIFWKSDFLPYSYLKQQSRTLQQFYEHIGKQQVKQTSVRSILNLFHYLENRGFTYRFVLASDDVWEQSYDKQILSTHQCQYVPINEYKGMREFARGSGLSHDGNHPNADGHRVVAQLVMQSLQK